MLGVDFSEHGGPLALATVDCWKSKGVGHAIVQYSQRMPQHLEILRQSGIPIESYVYLYWGVSPWNQTPMDRVRAAIAYGAPTVKRIWLDCEDTTHPFDAWQLQQCVDICVAAGLPCGIYTGSWWWRGYANNNTLFSALPLWDALYFSEAPEAQLQLTPLNIQGSFTPYGGWTRRTIWQWHNTTSLCGHSVDLNVLDASKSVTLEQMHLGAVSALHFARNGWNMSDLVQEDKAAVAELNRRVNGG